MPTPLLPQRQSLVAQTAAFLNGQIEQGEWRDWLPSERSLCQLLQVSRNTLRAALVQLAADRVIKPIHGAGNKILSKPSRRGAAQRGDHVALLTPEPIERLRPMQSLWIDDMRALLSERGLRLRVFHGHHYFGANPGPALEKLVTRNPHGCWILIFAEDTTQRWFSENRVPCVVAGSTYPGIDLPSRDLDHRAMCRHAAGVLLGLGHRHLAMLMVKSRRAGDLESEAGFLEGVKQSPHGDATAAVLHHEGSVTGLATAVRRLLKLRPLPTGLVVMHPHDYLATVTRLAQSGVRIPQDMSVLSRDDDPFLGFISPLPARYEVGPHLMARSLLPPVLELLEGNSVSQHSMRIIPKFLKGESIAAARV
jgi:LacI family transcriptional regulator